MAYQKHGRESYRKFSSSSDTASQIRVLVIPTAPQQSPFLLLLSTQPLPFLLGLDSQLARPW